MVKFNEERAKILTTAFKDHGEALLKKFPHILYQNDLFSILPSSETIERKILLTGLITLYDSTKQSKYHYKHMAKLYREDSDFFTLEKVLKMSKADAEFFARKKVYTSGGKGKLMHGFYTELARKYSGNIMNLVDEDILVTRERLEKLPGFRDALSGLFVQTLRDQNLFSFKNEEEFCPKVDFNDYNLGIALGIIDNPYSKQTEKRKKDYSHFLGAFAKKENINPFDLDSFMWVVVQTCKMKNPVVCQDICPFNGSYEGKRLFYYTRDYKERSKVEQEKQKLKIEVDQMMYKINWNV